MNYKDKFKFDETEEYLWVCLKNPGKEESYFYLSFRNWVYNLTICGLLIAGTYWKAVPAVLVGLALITWHSFHGMNHARQHSLWKKKYKSMAEKVEQSVAEPPES